MIAEDQTKVEADLNSKLEKAAKVIVFTSLKIQEYY
jgi:hypothetical protein